MRDALKNLALKLVGCPYIWGGSNPWTGFDCSGFVVWIYQVFGILPSGDWTAQLLYFELVQRAKDSPETPPPGDLAFYGKAGDAITHVMLTLGGDLCVGASGGDHTTTTPDEARRRGAMVKVKPIRYRKDFFGTVHVPFPGE